MQISQTETFKREYKKIMEFIDQTDNESKKNEVRGLLKELVNLVKKIDTMHLDIVSVGKLPDDSSEFRDRIIETRKKIFKIVDKN